MYTCMYGCILYMCVYVCICVHMRKYKYKHMYTSMNYVHIYGFAKACVIINERIYIYTYVIIYEFNYI